MRKGFWRLAPPLLVLLLTACASGESTSTSPFVQPSDGPITPIAIITSNATQIGVPPATAIPGTLPPGATITPRPSLGPTTTTAPGTPTTTPNPTIKATKLTVDGCCPHPQWLADSSGVIFYGTPLARRSATRDVGGRARGGYAATLQRRFWGVLSRPLADRHAGWRSHPDRAPGWDNGRRDPQWRTAGLSGRHE